MQINREVIISYESHSAVVVDDSILSREAKKKSVVLFIFGLVWLVGLVGCV